jgi:Ca2+-binding RTX toxin-like protein
MRRITPLRRGILLTALALLLALPSFGASTSTAGYWRFEEGTPGADASGEDSIIDSSGSGDHGTPFGGPTYRADVPVDRVRASGAVNRRSLEFHGPNDRVFFSSKFLFHKPVDATLEFWLKFSPLGHQSVFWTRHDNDDLNRFNIFVNGDSTIGFDYQTPSGDLHRLVGECCTGVRVPPHAWSHIAITRAGDVYRLYVNGQLRATATDSNPDLPTAVGWTLSGRLAFPFHGLIDEVRLSLGALEPPQFLNAGGTLCAGRPATIVGSPGDDVIGGTAGPDVIAGRGGSDVIMGLGGNDRICGGRGDDNLAGGGDDDRLRGDGGRDTLAGGYGADLLAGGAGDDRFDGGAGRDRGTFAGAEGGIEASLALGAARGQGEDVLVALEELSGSSFADVLRGDAGANTLRGRAGGDRLDGGDGIDLLDGMGGMDTCLNGERTVRCE